MTKWIVTLVLLAWSATAAAHEVVVTRNSNFRAAPNSSSEKLASLKPGAQARLLKVDPQNGYLNVLENDVGAGWVWSRNVQVFPEYDRDFYNHWRDEDSDCQKARDEVLIAESEIPVTFKAGGECKVLTGRWTDPYTGEVFTDPGDLDVDHMVPLRNAHRSGGYAWTKKKKASYANDLEHSEHLIAVKASANRSKGARGPEEWVPPLASYHCQYAMDWEAIKDRWGLTMTGAEAAAVETMKATCPE